MRGLGGQHLEQGGAVAVALAHADDAAATQLDPGAAHHRQGVQPVLVGAGADDPAVELGAGVEIVVVGGEAGLGQPRRLMGLEHAEGDAGLHADGVDSAHHLDHGVELGAVAHLAPCRAHAEARGAGRLGLGRRRHHLGRVHDLVAGQLHLGMVGRLRAIAAILRTAAGLDRKQAGALDGVGVVMLAVNAAGAVDQVEQRRLVDRQQFVDRPVGARRRGRRPRVHLAHGMRCRCRCSRDEEPTIADRPPAHQAFRKTALRRLF